MESNDDDQLRSLLREWKAPAVSPGLEDRVMKARRNWWDILLHGTIPVPVPVALGLVVVLVLSVWQTARSMQMISSCTAVVTAPAKPVQALATDCKATNRC